MLYTRFLEIRTMELRPFSEFEKFIIKRIVEIDNKNGYVVLNNILEEKIGKSVFPDDCFIELNSESDVNIQVRKDKVDVPPSVTYRKIDREVSRIIISIIRLFEDLEKWRLIHLSGDNKLKVLGIGSHDRDQFQTCNFINDDLKPKIFNYARKEIFPSEALKVLVKEKFRTPAQKNLRTTQITTGVAVAGLIIAAIGSVVIPLAKENTVTIKNDVIRGVVDVPKLNSIHQVRLSDESLVDEQLEGIEVALLNSQQDQKESILMLQSSIEIGFYELSREISKLAEKEINEDQEQELPDPVEEK